MAFPWCVHLNQCACVACVGLGDMAPIPDSRKTMKEEVLGMFCENVRPGLFPSAMYTVAVHS